MTEFLYDPEEIRRRSFEHVRSNLCADHLTDSQRRIARSVVHTTGDFAMADRLCFRGDPIRRAREALRAGLPILADVTMVRSGLRRSALEALDLDVHVYVHHPDVHERARTLELTRSAAALDLAAERHDRFLLCVGNAPTVLLRLIQRSSTLARRIPVVIGAPVGFVSVVESKRRLLESDFPCIVLEGNRGGSPVAATIMNAILGMVLETDD